MIDSSKRHSAVESGPVRIAVVGDVHLCWGPEDETWFRQAGHDLIVFVGDLAGYRPGPGVETARSIGRLPGRVLVMPGNHDAVHLLQLGAEVFDIGLLRRLTGHRMHRRVDALERAVGPGRLCGYSTHRYDDLGLTVVAGRPHSLGGPRIAFGRHVARRFGVSSMEESAERLCNLVDATTGPLLFVAHNGPTGLGATRHDIWGCDFRPEEGDHGDPDLRAAVDHALRSRRRVLAVVAGHMHHAVRGGGTRTWTVERDSVLYVNAARVPRVFDHDGRRVRHHVELIVDDGRVTVAPVLAPDGAQPVA